MSDIYNYEPLWGAWYIESFIGQGAYGQVYKIRREDFDETYYAAVKVISIPLDDIEIRQMKAEGLSDDSIRTFYHALAKDILSEITLMSKLRGNSHIVSIEDHQIIQHENGVGWDVLLRMELLQSLTDYIVENTFTIADVVKLGIHISRALELCAQKKIIHRDLKPDNIFVSPHGGFKLGDFGIARNIEQTMSGLSKRGTYSTMAPEVFKGEKYGPSVDTYALGIVMYSLLNQNRAPFLPDHPQTIMPADRDNALHQRMNGETIPPLKGIGPKLNSAVAKACAYNRKDRFDNPTEMRQTLEAIIGIGHIPAEVGYLSPCDADSFDADPSGTDQPKTDPSPVSPSRKLRHRPKHVAVLSACAALALAVIALVSWLALRGFSPSDILLSAQTEDQISQPLDSEDISTDATDTPADPANLSSESDAPASDPSPDSPESQTSTGTLLASDSFDRSAVSRGFGQASLGGAWLPDTRAGLFSTDGSRAVLTIDTSGWTSRARLADVNQADADVKVSIGVPQPLTTGAVRAWVSARLTNTFDGYHLRANIMPDGRVDTVEFMKRINGADTIFNHTPTSIILAPGETITLQLRVVGSSLQGKAWKTGTPEPGNWQYSITDTSLTAAGSVGFGVYIGASANPLPVKVTFDNFSATAR